MLAVLVPIAVVIITRFGSESIFTVLTEWTTMYTYCNNVVLSVSFNYIVDDGCTIRTVFTILSGEVFDEHCASCFSRLHIDESVVGIDFLTCHCCENGDGACCA